MTDDPFSSLRNQPPGNAKGRKRTTAESMTFKQALRFFWQRAVLARLRLLLPLASEVEHSDLYLSTGIKSRSLRIPLTKFRKTIYEGTDIKPFLIAGRRIHWYLVLFLIVILMLALSLTIILLG